MSRCSHCGWDDGWDVKQERIDTLTTKLAEQEAELTALQAELDAVREERRWRDVSVELPAANCAVDLVNINRYVADDFVNEPYITDVGCLKDWSGNGGGNYWSIRGERGHSIDAYTHWRPRGPLPPQPDSNKESGNEQAD